MAPADRLAARRPGRRRAVARGDGEEDAAEVRSSTVELRLSGNTVRGRASCACRRCLERDVSHRRLLGADLCKLRLLAEHVSSPAAKGHSSLR